MTARAPLLIQSSGKVEWWRIFFDRGDYHRVSVILSNGELVGLSADRASAHRQFTDAVNNQQKVEVGHDR